MNLVYHKLRNMSYKTSVKIDIAMLAVFCGLVTANVVAVIWKVTQ